MMGLIAVAPRTYCLTNDRLSAAVNRRLKDWSLPLKEVRKVEVFYSSNDQSKGTGTVIVHFSSGPKVLEGIFEAAAVADEIRFFSRKRREELGLIGSGPSLGEGSRVIFKSTPEGWVFMTEVGDPASLLLYGAAFCLTATLAGFIYIFITTASRGALTISLISGSALGAAICWVQGWRYTRRRFEVSTSPGWLSIRYVPSMPRSRKRYKISQVRNLRAFGSSGTRISADEVIARWTSADDVPFFPELINMLDPRNALAFDYGGRTITFGEDADLKPDDVVFLLWSLGKALGPEETGAEPEGDSRIRVRREGERMLIESEPRRQPRTVTGYAGLVLVGSVFLWLLALPLVTLLQDHSIGREFWVYLGIFLGCLALESVIVWRIFLELFNRQIIDAGPGGVSVKGTLWPYRRERKISVDDIRGISISNSRIYLGPLQDFYLGPEFYLGWLRHGDLLRVADLIKEVLGPRIELPSASAMIKRSDGL
ncbi:MAG TPA: hypothetical protein VM658_06820 [bacterium]|nr:hypothetical protein [bacterium]